MIIIIAIIITARIIIIATTTNVLRRKRLTQPIGTYDANYNNNNEATLIPDSLIDGERHRRGRGG